MADLTNHPGKRFSLEASPSSAAKPALHAVEPSTEESTAPLQAEIERLHREVEEANERAEEAERWLEIADSAMLEAEARARERITALEAQVEQRVAAAREAVKAEAQAKLAAARERLLEQAQAQLRTTAGRLRDQAEARARANQEELREAKSRLQAEVERRTGAERALSRTQQRLEALS
jgi:phage-related minor tail protein